MYTTNTLELLLNKLPKAAREAHEAPTITNNLLSVSVLCDAGCEVYFHNHGCEITFNGETITQGWRDQTTNMCRISLIPDGGNNIIPDDTTTDSESEVKMPTLFVNSIYGCETTGQLIYFYHATMGYPVISTWCEAIDAGYFLGWPSLSAKRVRKFIKVSEETEMGHMDQRKVGIRSTKSKKKKIQWNLSHKLLAMTRRITYICPLQKLRADSTAIKQDAFPSLRIEATVMW